MDHPQLEEYPVSVRLPVQWGDMDAYGHVNNTVFFRWFESARIAYLDRCGFLASYEQGRVGAILHSTECRFRSAVFFPDEVVVGARAREVRDDRFTMEYRVVSVGQDAVAGEGKGIIVAYDYANGAKAALPTSVRDRIDEIEAMAKR